MSYDIVFLKDGEVCKLPFQTPRGGTYCIDPGYNEAKFNMTYNYCKIMTKHGLGVHRHDDDPKELFVFEEHKAAEIAVKLAEVIPQMKNDSEVDYWKSTEGNVKKALINLLTIAVAVPPDAKCEDRS